MKKINTIDAFEKWLSTPEPARQPTAIQDLNLAPYSSQMTDQAFDEALFLGCDLSDSVAGHIVTTGGLVIPDISSQYFETHRPELYTPEELFDGFSFEQKNAYHQTFDYKVYKQYLNEGKGFVRNIKVSLARRIHDHSITEALNDIVDQHKVVAIMGGHGMERREKEYASIARIARTLTQQGYLLVSGGGPGAMEATHLGAYFATRPLTDLERAIEMLSIRPPGAEPHKEYADEDWLERAMRVIEAFPLSDDEKQRDCLSIGIPTWLYGHEPPAPFATKIAKYFANSVREEGLLAIAKHGVIFAPGSAGTLQEIFQDACQNHYGTMRYISPMILLGKQHWTETCPAWPLLQHVSSTRRYANLLSLTDSEEDVIQSITRYNPEEYKMAD